MNALHSLQGWVLCWYWSVQFTFLCRSQAESPVVGSTTLVWGGREQLLALAVLPEGYGPHHDFLYLYPVLLGSTSRLTSLSISPKYQPKLSPVRPTGLSMVILLPVQLLFSADATIKCCGIWLMAMSCCPYSGAQSGPGRALEQRADCEPTKPHGYCCCQVIRVSGGAQVDPLK